MGAQLGDVRSSDLIERLRQQMAPPQVSVNATKTFRQQSADVATADRIARSGETQISRKSQSLGGGPSLERTRLCANSLLTGKRTGNFVESVCLVRF